MCYHQILSLSGGLEKQTLLFPLAEARLRTKYGPLSLGGECQAKPVMSLMAISNTS
jgi:hypothetical protein